VTLCVNGSTACVTKPVIVSLASPPPVITGPASYCGNLTATYSVPAVTGAAYAWTVTNGTINGSSTQNNVSVTWGGTGTGTLTVTVSTKGKCPATKTINVEGCQVYMGECCHGVEFKTDLQSLTYAGNGVYTFTPALTVSGMSNIVRVTANIISSNLTYSSASCGTAGSVNSYVVGAPNVGNLTASIPVFNGDEVIWHGGPVSNISNLGFPMQIKFPPPPTNPHCQDYLTFCVKYTFTDSQCHTCEVIRCYGPFKRGGLIDVNSDTHSADKVIKVVPQAHSLTPNGSPSPSPARAPARANRSKTPTVSEDLVRGSVTFPQGKSLIDVSTKSKQDLVDPVPKGKNKCCSKGLRSAAMCCGRQE